MCDLAHVMRCCLLSHSLAAAAALQRKISSYRWRAQQQQQQQPAVGKYWLNTYVAHVRACVFTAAFSSALSAASRSLSGRDQQ